MVINTKGEIRWRAGQGEIRGGHCNVNQGSHKGITEKVTYEERIARGKGMIQVAMAGGEHARQRKEREDRQDWV